jgi:ParB/RepB/Spo0J family partition protein
MKIKIRDLKPNPYRDLKKYPIDKNKIEGLKASIKQTGFWDNILARENPSEKGKYQIAYGHHRLLALQQLDIIEIDIPVKNLSESEMVLIAVTENREQWDMNETRLLECVDTVKTFLDSELAKYETWEELAKSDESIKHSFEGHETKEGKPINPARIFGQAKGKGVGRTTILKFLGDGWKQWKIQHALIVLKDEELGRETIETFDKISNADQFRKSIKRVNERRKNKNKPVISKEEQKELAKNVKEEIEKSGIGGQGSKERNRAMNDIIDDFLGENDFDNMINSLVEKFEILNKETERVRVRMLDINTSFAELKIQKIENPQIIFETITKYEELFISFSDMVKIFGLEFKPKIKHHETKEN